LELTNIDPFSVICFIVRVSGSHTKNLLSLECRAIYHCVAQRVTQQIKWDAFIG